jgi:hypothetical protein
MDCIQARVACVRTHLAYQSVAACCCQYGRARCCLLCDQQLSWHHLQQDRRCLTYVYCYAHAFCDRVRVSAHRPIVCYILHKRHLALHIPLLRCCQHAMLLGRHLGGPFQPLSKSAHTETGLKRYTMPGLLVAVAVWLSHLTAWLSWTSVWLSSCPCDKEEFWCVSGGTV